MDAAESLQTKVRAVFFDAGNTLLYADPDEATVLAANAKRYGYPLDPSELSDHVTTAFHQLELRTVRDATFWSDNVSTREVWVNFYLQVLGNLGVDGAGPGIANETCSHFGQPSAWRIFPEVVDVLKTLRSRGIAVGIVSNWDLNLLKIVRELGLSKHLDFVVASGSFGHAKPYREIFEAAVARAKVSAASCIHVGDHYFSDVLGARAAGIKAALVDRKGRHPGYSATDCLVLRDLRELLALI